ncbi:YjaG family protein [Psychromonas sp. MME2]|uniref:YjaG family protein n=1 Tax=unclassified Psychromonas TaxID=2614957 RepID=UPI00339C77A1
MLDLPINNQLNKLAPWQQTVFCMALAEQTRLHFQLFCDAINSDNHQIINNINQLFWEKMTVKGAKVNFAIQQDHFEEIIPNVSDYDFYGVTPALDHCVIVSCVFNSFLTKSTDEALNASQTAFATIASFIELQSGEEIQQSDLEAEPLFKNQLALQLNILKMLDEQRSPELIKSIKKMVLDIGTTSLGIDLEG